MSKLTLDDIADLRAYERERDSFRAEIIELKKRRRVHVGPIVTLLFENRATVRFQIQEMARVEKIISDEGIQAELDVYNPLIPERGELNATLFIELTDDEQLRTWLPQLVGIERAVSLVVGDGPDEVVVPCTPEEEHEARLTRDEITASVHYIRFEVPEAVVARIDAGEPLAVAVSLPAYEHRTVLGDAPRDELLGDLRG